MKRLEFNNIEWLQNGIYEAIYTRAMFDGLTRIMIHKNKKEFFCMVTNGMNRDEINEVINLFYYYI